MVAVQLLADEQHLFSETACEDIIIKGNVAHIQHGGRWEEIEFVKYSRMVQDEVLVYKLYVTPGAGAPAEEPETEQEQEGTPLPFEERKEENKEE